VLLSESQTQFDQLLAQIQQEHQPETPTEEALVQAEHHWLRHRAMRLEESCFDYTTGQIIDERKLALRLRYQTTHERAFHKALNDLLKLEPKNERPNWMRPRFQRAEDSSKAFERQQHAQADQIRKQECHEMEKERQKWTTLLAEAKLYSQQPVTTRREIMTEALTSKLPTPNS
jgi:hypothetical protein